jgi:hypothetical protein
MIEYTLIAILLIALAWQTWRKRVWKRRAKIADWPENVLLANINAAATRVEALQAWAKRKNPKEIKAKEWPDSLDE